MREVARTNLPDLKLLARGKVRDVYEVDSEHILLVATDRISAFDVVFDDPVPGKGIILTQLSLFWFDLLRDVTTNHLMESDVDRMPREVRKHADVLRGRTMLVRRARVHPAECIARGYLLGSGWKDYQKSGKVCGIPLPAGLRKNHRFKPALFTPSTKATVGHDENISFESLVEMVGPETATKLKEKTLAVFDRASSHAEGRGVIICDTKFEWGDIQGALTLVDEVLTPDSSRFWRKEEALAVLPDGDPPSYDKQVVRNYLETLTWNKQPPAPRLPKEIIAMARQRYIEIYQRIAGQSVPHL